MAGSKDQHNCNMMRSQLREKIGSRFDLTVFLGFLIAISLFTFLSINVYRNNQAQLEAVMLVAHSNEVLLCTERLLENLFEAETGQRGFIITGEKVFLEPYFTAIDSINYYFETLKTLTSDSPLIQQLLNELAPLIDERIQGLGDNLKLREADGFEETKEVLMSLEGKKVMDSIKWNLGKIQIIERQLLAERKKQTELQVAAFNTTYFTTFAFVGIVLIGLFFIIYTNVQARDKSEKALVKYKNELEHTVQERTSELVKSLKALGQSNDLLSEMEKLAKVGGWVLNLENMTVHWTDEVYRIHEMEPGATPTVEMGVSYYAPEARPVIQDAVNEAIQSGKNWDLELPFITATGKRLWVRVIGKAEFEDGQAKRVYGTFQDITEQREDKNQIKKLNEELELRVKERTLQLEFANKELESFSYSVSHDLRAPLRSINGYANALVEDYAPILDEEGKRLLRIIINSAKRMGQLIDDLLAFSRLGRQPLVKSEVNMHDFVQQIAEELIREINGRSLTFELKPMGMVMADASMLRQVWINLLSNALKYSQKKEKSIVEVGCLNDKNNKKIFYVKDNGAGFDMNYSGKLFNVFQRLHKVSEFDGTGVGLALTKRIIDKHGGQIWAEAEVEKGATFYFSLPYT